MGSDLTCGAWWSDREIDPTGFGNARLGGRLRKLMSQLDGALGQPIALACEDWANTKAAYGSLSNASVNEAPIVAGHFRASRSPL